MNKSLVITLALVFALSIASTAFAAANPFVDVPAKHWAYESVAKLAKAGIVDGYGDGTFRGDKTITRYEMATIVAKAMANQEKADAAQKAEIAKLETEFSDELNKLGVRVGALENKVGNIKFTGEVRARYEWTKEPNDPTKNPAEKTRLRLGMDAQLTDSLSFVGRYQAESLVGGQTAPSQLNLAYLSGKAFGNGTFTLGRQPVFLGKGLIYDGDGADCVQDGVSFSFGDKLKFTGSAFKTGGDNNPLPNVNILAANVDWAVNKDFDLTLVYAKTKEDIVDNSDPNNNKGLKTWAAGIDYNGIPNIGLTFEYGKNTSDAAKHDTAGGAKAWMAKAKYLGANCDKPQSYGLWVGYRKADKGFFNNTTLDSTDAMQVGCLNNVKGFEYGFEYTVFKNSILTLQYNNLKSNDNQNTNGNNFIAQLVYSF